MKGVNSKNIAKVITDKVLAELKNDPGKWIKSWSDANRPVNLVTGREYTGCNWLWLAMMQGHEGNDSNEWCTYNQAKELTGLDYPIKKGSKGQPVILYKPQKIKKLVDGELKEQSFPIMRVFQVFNRSVIEGLPPRENPAEEEMLRSLTTLEVLGTYDEIFSNSAKNTKYKLVHPYDTPISFVTEIFNCPMNS